MPITAGHLCDAPLIRLDEAASLVGIDRTVYGTAHTVLADALTTAALLGAGPSLP